MPPTITPAPPRAPTIGVAPPVGLVPCDPATLGTPGRQIDRYEVERELGRGGMGVVLLVRDPILDRRLALKVILGDSDGEALTRFGREAQVMARVRHKNVVGVHELGRAAEGPFIVSDLVEGVSLIDLVATPLEPREAARIVRDLADGLAACHAVGIIHRDLKPHNVIVKPDGTPVVLDFGIARDQTAEALTQTGQFMGTPNYMSPEQLDGTHPSALDQRVDVYGLGAILFQCLGGLPPFHDGTSAIDVLQKVMHDEPEWPRTANRAIPAELEAIVQVSMAKDRNARHATASDLRDDLDRWLRGERPHAADRVPALLHRRLLRVATALVALAVLLGIAVAVAVVLPRDGAGERAREVARRADLVVQQVADAKDPAVAAQQWLAEHASRRWAADPVVAAATPRVQEISDSAVRESIAAHGDSLERMTTWIDTHESTHPAARAMRARRDRRKHESSAWQELSRLEGAEELPTRRSGVVERWRAEHRCGEGDCAAVGSADRLLEAVRADLPDEVRLEVRAPVMVVALDDDRAFFATRTDDPALCRLGILDLGSSRRHAWGHQGLLGLRAAAVTPDREHVVVVTADRKAIVLGLDGAPVTTVDFSRLPGVGMPRSLAVTNTRLAIGCNGPAMVITADLDGAHMVWAVSSRAETMEGLAFMGDVLVTASGSPLTTDIGDATEDPKAIECWRLNDAGPAVRIGSRATYESYGRALALSPAQPGGERHAVVGTGNGALHVFPADERAGCDADPHPDRFLGQAAVNEDGLPPRSHSGEVSGIAFVDSRSFVSVSTGPRSCEGRYTNATGWPEVRMWTLEGEEILLERAPGRPPAARRWTAALASVAIARGALLVGTADGNILIWRRATR